MLVLREVMNPAYGLFHEDEESHLIWFSDSLVRRGDRVRIYKILTLSAYVLATYVPPSSVVHMYVSAIPQAGSDSWCTCVCCHCQPINCS